jgi:hypothetical protein
MKTETIEEWQKRTGKEPTKVKVNHNEKFYYAWIVRGKLKLKKKRLITKV